jgi:hypothetical protein
MTLLSTLWWVAAEAAQPAGQCAVLVDGAPAERLDCAAGGAWTVRCEVPEGVSGKIRVRAELPARGLVGEARIPLAEQRQLVIPLAGPGGRAGGFVVDRPSGGLLPGQALGPNEWCPVVQPDVAPGSPPAALPLHVTVSAHERTGFAEETLAGGVTSRVPVYGPGEEIASVEVPVVQREVGTVPVLTGPIPPSEEAVRGQLSLAGADGAWRSLGYTGSRERVDVPTGEVQLLVLDFVAPEVASATGSDAATWVRGDLERWLGGDASALLGIAAWARSELRTPRAVVWAERDEGGRRWAIGTSERAEVRVGRFGDRVRATIAWRAASWDREALGAVAEAVARGL